MHSKEQLEEMQRLPLHRKIQITTARIIEWYQHYNGMVYVAFSGGKDSTVLLDNARRIYPDIPAVNSDTSLEIHPAPHKVKSIPNITKKKTKKKNQKNFRGPVLSFPRFGIS